MSIRKLSLILGVLIFVWLTSLIPQRHEGTAGDSVNRWPSINRRSAIGNGQSSSVIRHSSFVTRHSHVGNRQSPITNRPSSSVIRHSSLVTRHSHVGNRQSTSRNINPQSAIRNPQSGNAPNLAALPLIFERNDGQADGSVKFLSRGPEGSLFFTDSEIIFGSSNLRMRFVGAHAMPEIEGVDALPGKSNYLLGNDPGRWTTGVQQYAKVKYSQIYPGIDLVFYGNQNELEYDLVVAPGADPGLLQMEFLEERLGGSGRGADGEIDGKREKGTETTHRTATGRARRARLASADLRLRIDANGDLVLQTSAGEMRHSKPKIYQEVNGIKFPVPGRFVVKDGLTTET